MTSIEEKRILQPMLGGFIACWVFYYMFSFAAINWCEHYHDFSSPLYFTSVALAISSIVAGAVCWIRIVRTVQKVTLKNE